jgi:hypothetical protein
LTIGILNSQALLLERKKPHGVGPPMKLPTILFCHLGPSRTHACTEVKSRAQGFAGWQRILAFHLTSISLRALEKSLQID